MRVRRREDDLLDRVGVVDARGQGQQVHHLVDRDVGLYLASDRLRERGDVGGRQLLRLLTDGEQHLLLPARSSEVALQIVVARAHVLERMYAVQVLRAGQDCDARVAVRTIGVDVERV